MGFSGNKPISEDIMYDADGYQVFTKDGYSIVSATSGLHIAGKDSSTSRFITVDSSGRVNMNIGTWMGSNVPTIGQKSMSQSVPIVISNDQSSVNVKLADESGSKLGVEDGYDIPLGTDGILYMGTDYSGKSRRIRTTDDGRLVVNSAVSAPPNNTGVSVNYTGSVNTTTDNFYTIPTSQVLKIQRFAGGGEEATGGSKIELYYAPNGNNTSLQLIRMAFVNGNNFEFTLDYNIPDVGNGTRAILVKRIRLSGGAIEIAAFWDGYY